MSTLPAPAVISAISIQTADTALFLVTPQRGADEPASRFLPGQFLELSVPGAGEIPVSYCGLPRPDGAIELCIRNVGHVTAALHALSVGCEVAVRGPYGHGFPLDAMEGRNLLLVAGGLGMAPIRSLLLRALERRTSFSSLTLLYGAGSPGALLFREELNRLAALDGLRLLLAVERAGGCRGELPPYRVALLPALLDDVELKPGGSVAICGPPEAYPILVERLRLRGIDEARMHLSLERRMKCGVGLCGHCAVGDLLCCQDGPVFSCAVLKGIEGAL